MRKSLERRAEREPRLYTRWSATALVSSIVWVQRGMQTETEREIIHCLRGTRARELEGRTTAHEGGSGLSRPSKQTQGEGSVLCLRSSSRSLITDHSFTRLPLLSRPAFLSPSQRISCVRPLLSVACEQESLMPSFLARLLLLPPCFRYQLCPSTPAAHLLRCLSCFSCPQTSRQSSPSRAFLFLRHSDLCCPDVDLRTHAGRFDAGCRCCCSL